MEQVCGAEALLVAMVRVLCAYPTVELAKSPLLHGVAGETWMPAPAGAGVGLVVMVWGMGRLLLPPLTVTPVPLHVGVMLHGVLYHGSAIATLAVSVMPIAMLDVLASIGPGGGGV